MTNHRTHGGWKSPIYVEDPATGQTSIIRNAKQAKTVLAQAWPAYHGSQFGRAERTCDEALAGSSTPNEARCAFIAAAVEAHLHLHS